jgi:hypothetical protein
MLEVSAPIVRFQLNADSLVYKGWRPFTHRIMDIEKFKHRETTKQKTQEYYELALVRAFDDNSMLDGLV